MELKPSIRTYLRQNVKLFTNTTWNALQKDQTKALKSITKNKKCHNS